MGTKERTIPIYKRVLALVLVLVMLFGNLAITSNMSFAQTPNNIDLTPRTTDVEFNEVRMPNARSAYAGEKELKGMADPNATIDIGINGSITTVQANAEGLFTLELTKPLVVDDVLTYQAKIGNKTSVVANHVVADKYELIAPNYDSKVFIGTGITNGGLREDGSKYLLVGLRTYSVFSAWTSFAEGIRNAKIYYQLPDSIAPYVTSVQIDRDGLFGSTYTLEKNETILPGYHVWESGMLNNEKQKGWLRSVVAGVSTGQLRINLRDDVPLDLLKEGVQFGMFAFDHTNKKLIQDFNRTTLLFDRESNDLSTDEFFKDNIAYERFPVADKIYYDYGNKFLDMRYSVATNDHNLTGLGFSERLRPYDLYIKFDPRLKDVLYTKTIVAGTYSEQEDMAFSQDTPEYPLEYDAQFDRYIIRDLYHTKTVNGNTKPLLAKSSSIRQDIGIRLRFEEGKDIGGVMNNQKEFFEFEMGILDNEPLNFLNRAKASISEVKSDWGQACFALARKELDNWIAKKEANPQATFDTSEPAGTVVPKNSAVDMVVFAAKYPTPQNLQYLKDLNNAYTNIGQPFPRIRQGKVEKAIADLIPCLEHDGLQNEMKFTRASTFLETSDIDRDGILDKFEQKSFIGTNFTNKDTDGDGKEDGAELLSGTDPIVAPYNWYDLNGKKYEHLTQDVTTISGKVVNNSSIYNGLTDLPEAQDPLENVVFKRRIQVVNRISDTDQVVLAEGYSNEDAEGTFSIDVTGKLQVGQNIVVRIFTDESKRNVEYGTSDKHEVIVQQAYEKPEVSYAIRVQKPLQDVTFKHNYKSGDPDFATQPADILEKVEKDTAIGTQMPADPTRDGFSFEGWKTTPDNTGEAVTSATVITGALTAYAQWLHMYTATFNANQGTFVPEANEQAPVTQVTQAVKEGQTLSELTLREPVRENYDFLGWATTENATSVDASVMSTPITGDSAYFAVWKQQASAKPVIQPVKDSDTQILVKYPDGTTHEAGDTATVTVPGVATPVDAVWDDAKDAFVADVPAGANMAAGGEVHANLTENGKLPTEADPVTITASNATVYEPVGKPEIVPNGGTYDLTDNVTNKENTPALPAGTTFEDVTKTESTNPVNVEVAGNYDGKVKVNYPDGSSEIVDVPVTVLEKVIVNPVDPTPEGYVRITFDAGVNGKFATGAATVFDAKKGIPFSEITVPQVIANDDWKHVGWAPALPAVVPAENETYLAEYDRTDAFKYSPEGILEKIPHGGSYDLTDNVTNKANTPELPVGTTFVDVTTDVNPEGIDVTKVGKQSGYVKVTYPDKSTEIVEVPVEVLPIVIPNPDPDSPVPDGYVRLSFVAGDNGALHADDVKLYDAKIGIPFEGNITVPRTIPNAGYEDERWTPDCTEAGYTVPNQSVIYTASFKEIGQSQPPAISTMTEGDTTISGTGVAGSEISVTLPDKTVATTTVEADGTWKIENVTPLVKDDVVSVTQTEVGKKTSNPIEGVVLGKIIPNPDKPTPDGYVRITFKAGPGGSLEGTTIYDVKPGLEFAQLVPKAVADATHLFDTWDALPQTVPNESSSYTAYFKAKEASAVPHIIQPTVGETEVKGTGVPGAEVTVTLPDATKVTTTVDPDGNWSVVTPALEEGQTVSATQTEENKLPSEPVTKNVLPEVIPDPTPGSEVPEGYARVIFKADKNGTLKGAHTSFDAKIGIPMKKLPVPTPVANDTFKFKGWVPELDPETAVVPKEGGTWVATFEAMETTEKPHIIQPTVGETEVKGTGVPGAEVTVTLPDKTEVTTTVDPDGNWSVVTPALEEGQEVSATQTEDGKLPSKPETKKVLPKVIPVVDPTTPTPEGYVRVSFASSKGGHLDGQTLFDVKIGTPFNKITVPTPVADADHNLGSWDKAFPAKVEKEAVYVYSFVLKGKTPKPTVEQPAEGDTTVDGTGEPGATVDVTLPDGTTETTTVDPDGNWSVPTKPLKPGQEVVVIQKEDGKKPSDPVKEVVLPEIIESPAGNTPDGYVRITFTAGENGTLSGKHKVFDVKIGVVFGKITVPTPVANKGYQVGKWKPALPEKTQPVKKTANYVANFVSEQWSRTPSIYRPFEDQTKLRGGGVPGATVHVQLPNGKKVDVKVDTLGEWEVACDPLVKGQIVKATQTEPGLRTSKEVAGPVYPKPTNKYIYRFAGKDRAETAALASAYAYVNSTNVIIANGYRYPDVLSSVALSRVLDAPILLTRGNMVPDATIKEIKRLGATHAILVGGTSVIPTNIPELLKTKAGILTIERQGGKDRYETSTLMAKRVIKVTNVTDTIFITRGDDFPDALSLSNLSAAMRTPILLTRPNKLPENAKALLGEMKLEMVYIAGGVKAVSLDIENYLKKMTTDLERLGGANRYETAIAIANKAYPTPEKAIFASGENFVDAMVVGPLTSKLNAPMILVRKDVLPVSVTEYLKTGVGKKVNFAYIAGGTAAITKKVEQDIKSLIK